MRQNRCEERKETERLIKRLVYYPDLTTPPAADSISASGGVSSLSIKRDIYRRNRHFINGSSMCICYLSREDSGTEKTVRVARKEGLQIINIAEKA